MFESTPKEATFALWIVWLASWLIAAAWSSRTVKRATLGLQLPYQILTGLGVVLLFTQSRGDGIIELRWWDAGAALGWSLTAVVAVGLGFTWWARLHLGRLWSDTVTQKAEHRIVESGPYAIVRHPIYTGLLLAVSATAALLATGRTVAGAVLIALGFFVKARLEERFLRRDLGVAYDEYRRRVPMLVPSLRS